jgi:hypothetical protein
MMNGIKAAPDCALLGAVGGAAMASGSPRWIGNDLQREAWGGDESISPTRDGARFGQPSVMGRGRARQMNGKDFSFHVAPIPKLVRFVSPSMAGGK